MNINALPSGVKFVAGWVVLFVVLSAMIDAGEGPAELSAAIATLVAGGATFAYLPKAVTALGL